MGNRHTYVMWFVLASVVVLLGALIVAIAMDVRISTQTSVAILVACGVISVALILTSSRLASGRRPRTELQGEPADGRPVDEGKVSNWIFLADAHFEREEFESAEKLYRRAVEAGHRGAAGRLGEVLYELGQDEEAEYYKRIAAEAGE